VKVRLLTAAATIGLASVAWTTAAAADNPHGTPPGQQVSAAATANASTQTNASAHANGRAHVKGAVVVEAQSQAKAKASGHANGAVKTQAQTQAPTVSAGVKPTSATSKNTFAAATSNQTKLYGNGKTAGQIAIQAGFGSSTLYGPGNSQPHKTACGPHMIDVHALKAHGAAACAVTPASPGATASVGATSSVSPAVAQATVGTSAAAQAAAQAAGKSSVLGAKASQPAKTQKHAGGVLGAKAKLAAAAKKPLRLVATVRHGNLPFTGLPLWMPMAFGLGLIATGLAMRRRGNSLI
jgi:hypothetical protein